MTSSAWRLENVNVPVEVGATFANSSSDYPFKQSNILKMSVIYEYYMVKQATRTKLLKKKFY